MSRRGGRRAVSAERHEEPVAVQRKVLGRTRDVSTGSSPVTVVTERVEQYEPGPGAGASDPKGTS